MSNENSNFVTIYSDSNYNGKSQQLNIGNYDKKNLSIGNDKLSSIKVPPGRKVMLFDDDGFKGNFQIITADTPNVGGFNDKVSSIIVESVDVEINWSPNVLVFDGTTAYGEAQLNVSETDFTVSIWFKTTNGNCGIFSADSGDRGANGYDRNLYLKDGNIYARLWSNETIFSQDKNLADGKWHKLVYAFGGVVGGQRIYIDGLLVASGIKQQSDFAQQDGINVGFCPDAASPYFWGEISEVAIWNIARPKTSLMVMEETIMGNETGLLACWNFCDSMIVPIMGIDPKTFRIKISGCVINSLCQDKMPLKTSGNVTRKFAKDFGGVYVPLVDSTERNKIRAKGTEYAKNGKPLSYGRTPATYANAQTQEQFSKQVNAGKKMLQTKTSTGNTLSLTADSMGDFQEVANVANKILSGFITISDPHVKIVEIEPGQSGVEKAVISSDLLISDPVTTLRATALQLSGKATILPALNGGFKVSLQYAEFSQLNTTFYGIIKLVGEDDLGFATFLPAVANVPLLKNISISQPTFILSSTGEITDAVLNTGLVKGFNLFGTLSLNKFIDPRINKFFRIKDDLQISLHSAIDFSGEMPSLLMEATIPINYDIFKGKSFTFHLSETTLGVTVKDAQPAIHMFGEMVVTLKKDTPDETHLVFTGGFKLEPESVTAMFTMEAENKKPYTSLKGNVVSKGEWVKPFGIPGLVIRELALQAGVSYAEPWVDNIGVHGNLKIGNPFQPDDPHAVDGSISVLVDAHHPDQFVLAGATDHITLIQIMTSFDPVTFAAYTALPGNIKNLLDQIVNISLDDVQIHIVPVATSIGAINFEQGILLQGTLIMWGWHAKLYVRIDATNGLKVTGEMDRLEYYNVVRITGSGNDYAPKLNVNLSPNLFKPAAIAIGPIGIFQITADVSFLGLSIETIIQITTAGLTYHFEAKIGDLIDAKLDFIINTGGVLANGSITFQIKIGKLNIGLVGKIDLKAGPKYGFYLYLEGDFLFDGKTHRITALTLFASPGDFQSFYNQAKEQVKAELNSIPGKVKGWFDDQVETANEVKDVFSKVLIHH